MNYVAAVSQRIDVWPKREEVRDSLDQKMINFLAACGILGFPIPNTIPSQSQLTSWLNHLKPDLLVISGGNDIGQNFDRDKNITVLRYGFLIRNYPMWCLSITVWIEVTTTSLRVK